MPIFRGTRLALLGGGQSYIDKVLSHGPIAYWPMNEPTGSVSRCFVNTAQNGAYTGVTLGQPGIGDGLTCSLFDGTNDYNNIYTTTFRDAFNVLEGTAIIWLKVNDASVWEDDANRVAIQLWSSASNHFYIRRQSSDNQLRYQYKAGGTTSAVTVSSLTSVDFMYLAITWSKSTGTGEVKAYMDGVQTGTTKVNLGTWSGNLIDARSLIGAGNTVGPDQVCHGWLAHGAVWTRALSAAAILDLATL